MVEMETAPLERSGEREMVWSASTAFQILQLGGHGVDGGLSSFLEMQLCGISPFVHRMIATRSGSWAMETICKIWAKPSLDEVNVWTQWRCTSCLVHPASWWDALC